jgi:hypothetical protein
LGRPFELAAEPFAELDVGRGCEHDDAFDLDRRPALPPTTLHNQPRCCAQIAKITTTAGTADRTTSTTEWLGQCETTRAAP